MDDLIDLNEFNIDEQAAIDAMFEEELLTYIEAKMKAKRYVRTCELVIESYERKIEKAKERVDDIEERTKLMMYSTIRKNIEDGIITKESVSENDKCYIYSIPSAKFIIIKPEPIVEDEKMLGEWMVINQVFFTDHDGNIDLEKIKSSCQVVNGEVVFKDTGLIVEGMNISEERLEIKLLKGGK